VRTDCPPLRQDDGLMSGSPSSFYFINNFLHLDYLNCLMPSRSKKNGKSAKPRRVQRRRRNQQQRTSRVTRHDGPIPRHHVKLGAGTAAYATALINPISGPLVDVPNAPALWCRVYRTFNRSQFGTALGGNAPGIGFVASDPFGGVVNNPGGLSVRSSSSTYAPVAISTLELGAPGVIATGSNSDYATASVGIGPTQFEFRPVAHLLRMRYTGTELNRGGQIFALQDPNHRSVQGRQVADFGADINCKRFTVNRVWKNILYKPAHHSDYDYQSAIPAYTPANTDERFFMAFMVTSADPAVSVTFEFEAWTITAAHGAAIRGTAPSPVDVVGFHAVQGTTSLPDFFLPFEGDVEPESHRFLAGVAQYLCEQTSSVTPLTAPRQYHTPRDSSGVMVDPKSQDPALGLAGTALGLGSAMAIANLLDWLL
jgi:hypothetical protein